MMNIWNDTNIMIDLMKEQMYFRIKKDHILLAGDKQGKTGICLKQFTHLGNKRREKCN
jgi:hypothetical protein